MSTKNNLNKDQFLKEVKELCIKYGISIAHGNKDVGYLNFKLVDYAGIYMADLMSALDHTTSREDSLNELAKQAQELKERNTYLENLSVRRDLKMDDVMKEKNKLLEERFSNKQKHKSEMEEVCCKLQEEVAKNQVLLKENNRLTVAYEGMINEGGLNYMVNKLKDVQIENDILESKLNEMKEQLKDAIDKILEGISEHIQDTIGNAYDLFAEGTITRQKYIDFLLLQAKMLNKEAEGHKEFMDKLDILKN